MRKATLLLMLLAIFSLPALGQKKHSFMFPNPSGYSLDSMRELSPLRTYWVSRPRYYERLAQVMNEATKKFPDVITTRDSFIFQMCGASYAIAHWTPATARYVWENYTKLSEPAVGGRMRTMDWVDTLGNIRTVDRPERVGEVSVTFTYEDMDDFPEEIGSSSKHEIGLASTWCGQPAHGEIEYIQCDAPLPVKSEPVWSGFNNLNNNYTTNNYYPKQDLPAIPKERKYLGLKIGIVTIGIAGIGTVIYYAVKNNQSPSEPEPAPTYSGGHNNPGSSSNSTTYSGGHNNPK